MGNVLGIFKPADQIAWIIGKDSTTFLNEKYQIDIKSQFILSEIAVAMSF